MKTLVECINEKLSGLLTEASADFVKFIKSLQYETKEPKKDQEDYIKFEASDAHFWTKADAWVKVNDLGKYTDELGLMSVAYNLMKTINPKITLVDIMYWDGEGWNSFAIASLSRANRSWDAQYIKNEKYKKIFK